MTALPPGIVERLKTLPRGLRDHIRRAREVGTTLARQHEVDEAKCDLAIAAHDLARDLKGEALLDQARHYGQPPHPVELTAPTLLHGTVAALWLEHEYGVADSEVLEAVRWHTTGRNRMGQVAKVVFLADKLDPAKVKRYPHLEKVQSLAQRSLDWALLEFLDHELSYLLRSGRAVHPASVELRNQLLNPSLDEIEDRFILTSRRR